MFYQEVGDEHNTRYHAQPRPRRDEQRLRDLRADLDERREAHRSSSRITSGQGDNLTQDADSPDYNQYDGLRGSPTPTSRTIRRTGRVSSPTRPARLAPGRSIHEQSRSRRSRSPPSQRRCPRICTTSSRRAASGSSTRGAVLVDNSIGGCQGVGRALLVRAARRVCSTRRSIRRQAAGAAEPEAQGSSGSSRTTAPARATRVSTARRSSGSRSEILNPRRGRRAERPPHHRDVRAVHGDPQQKARGVAPAELVCPEGGPLRDQRGERDPGDRGRAGRRGSRRLVPAAGFRGGREQRQQGRPLRAMPVRQRDQYLRRQAAEARPEVGRQARLRGPDSDPAGPALPRWRHLPRRETATPISSGFRSAT